MLAVTEPRRNAGRPEATSHAEIEQAAFRLFAERGFDETTLDAIAEAVGVSRRTLFRYYASKNDIPWGQFDQTLDHFRDLLREQPAGRPLWESVHVAVRQFNEFPRDADPPHAERMRLILETPTLEAHSVLRYAQWRNVIAEHVAARLGQSPDDPLPYTVGHISLAIALSAYREWLGDTNLSVTNLIDDAMQRLRDYMSAG